MPKHKLCNKTSSQKNLKSINTKKQNNKTNFTLENPKKLFILVWIPRGETIT
jgi:hypothetical protein